MKQCLFLLSWLLALQMAMAQSHETYVNDVRSVRVMVNNDWQAVPIVELNSDDYLEVSFDQLSHQYHRYIYKIVHCNANWQPSELNEIDYLDGFNNNVIEDYQNSFNTTMLYTHYKIFLPNENVQLKVSGNYRLCVYDEEKDNEPILTACFSIVDPQINIAATVSSNTEIDTNASHQQVSFEVIHDGYNIRNPNTEVKVHVLQNNRRDNCVTDLLPTYQQPGRLQYTHNQKLIFEAGNEYRRFELVNVHYATQGVDHIRLFDPYYHATLFTDEARHNYSYDEDQNGRHFVRYNQAEDNDTEADYLFVHFSLAPDKPLIGGKLYLQGDFTYDRYDSTNQLKYNPDTYTYEGVQLLKQGAYNYQYLFVPEGSVQGHPQPIEGSFYETENEYLILVYHRPFGERYDRLIGMKQIRFN